MSQESGAPTSAPGLRLPCAARLTHSQTHVGSGTKPTQRYIVSRDWLRSLCANACAAVSHVPGFHNQDADDPSRNRLSNWDSSFKIQHVFI